MSAVGFLCYISLLWYIVVFSRVFVLCHLLIIDNLLQVVSSQSEFGRGPGASA
jgi:hypothetical protein